MTSISGGGLHLSIDPTTGQWASLTGGAIARSWLSVDGVAGLPFVGGSGLHNGATVAVPQEAYADSLWQGRSHRGETAVSIAGSDEAITVDVDFPDRRGPRAGYRLDLDHLDSQDHEKDRDIFNALMPVMFETAEDLSWAWIAWHRNELELLVTAIDGLSAGWHIRYSYAGHRMVGFEILARADDVIAETWQGQRLPTTTHVRVRMCLAADRAAAQKQAAQLLGLGMGVPQETATVIGGSVSYQQVGEISSCELIRPTGETQTFSDIPESVRFDEAGVWKLRSHSVSCPEKSVRYHESQVVVLEPWHDVADRVLAAHRKYYQLSCGAFARVVNKDLLPEGRNFGYDHFGDPDELQSCRVGEFGGFAAWAQLKAQEFRGHDPIRSASIDAYFGWMFNRGREENPRVNTLCFTKQEAHGRQYGPYHFYQEICYAQHEAWFIRQLADAVALGDGPVEEYLRHLVGLVQHYLAEHLDEQGVVWNQNWPDETPVDYGTVDCPLVHLLRAAEVLEDHHPALAATLWARTRLMADHLCRRGFDFPTEGEPCTEDGSIACQAWGLATAYNTLPAPDPQWLELAEKLMQFHHKLELSGSNCYINGSSLRFWETMYETDEWGPSINAGHGWTLWSAWARWELFRATGAFEHLQQAWRHCGAVAAKIQPDGTIPSCFTPDPVPQLPHDDAWGEAHKRHEGLMTTAVAGNRFPAGRAMSSMHLFIVAPTIWSTTCGYDFSTGSGFNACLEQGGLKPNTDAPRATLALRGAWTKPVRVTGLAEKVTILHEKVTGDLARSEVSSDAGCLTLPVPSDRES